MLRTPLTKEEEGAKIPASTCRRQQVSSPSALQAHFPPVWGRFCLTLSLQNFIFLFVWGGWSDLLSTDHQFKCYPACALRALGSLLANGAPTVGWGKTFWCVVFGNEKSHNIRRYEMDSLAKGYKRAIDKIKNQMAKTDFRTEIRIFRPKKCTLLGQNHVLATTRQSCAKKKYPFPK